MRFLKVGKSVMLRVFGVDEGIATKSIRETTGKRALLLLACACVALACCALTACASVPASSSSAAESVSAQPVPRVAMAAPPEIAFERTGDATVALHVSVPLASDAADPVALRYQAALVLQDAAGDTLHAERKQQLTAVSSSNPRAIAFTVALDSETYANLASVRFACMGWNGALACISPGKEAYPVDPARQAYAAAEQERQRLEAERAQKEHEAQWREKFPTDDYSNTILIGDSIMQNTSSVLRDVLPDVTIDADAGRTLEEGGLVFEGGSPDQGVLDHIRRDEGDYDRYVIGTGNNDAGGVTEDDAEEIISLLGPDKEIYFVTMYVRGNAHGTSVTNNTIDDMVDEYSNVHKIDWYDVVSENPSEYLTDGCHPRPDRYADYAYCIKDGLDVVY